jgi:hypothetical protein
MDRMDFLQYQRKEQEEVSPDQRKEQEEVSPELESTTPRTRLKYIAAYIQKKYQMQCNRQAKNTLTESLI